ncbi:MAG TPA: sodium:solute symporter family protein [Sedimentisphaerales bacterium]|nr:sodium:solute symporter family protein [Sedimentisphaerales bacterium]
MELHSIDICIIIGYLVVVVIMGWLLSKRASKNLDAYFLGDKSLPWYVIGTSHGASGFDITGTMWFVVMLFTYGVKAAFIPWIWPLFDRVFRQVYLGPWIRRSNVLTGAEWMRTRFGKDLGGNLSHISVVVYAMVATVGFLGYAFQGIGKFAEVFFPWDLAWGPFSSTDMYAIVILGITTVYLLLGGWYSVVLTDLLQFGLLTVASVFIAIVAINKVTPEALAKVVPAGWNELLFGWKLNLDWSGLIDQLNTKISDDGFSLFGVLIMMMLFKGLLVSMAGPSPGYGMQHVLSTRNPREAALENWWMSIVQLVPRFLMITGIAVLGLVYFSPQVNQMLAAGEKFDFEKILPYVIKDFVPVGLVGVLLAGLLAAFMSTFDSTVNAGAAYLVNDIYKRYLNPNASTKRYVYFSYFCSVLLVVVAIVVGIRIKSIHNITTWIAFGLYGGYVTPNILKWHWWRFNGYGYFAGMIAGVVAALVPLLIVPDMNRIYILPFSLLISTIASIVVCLRTPPEKDEVLESFYRNVRPWGFWKPVYENLVRKNPNLQKNTNFRRDAFNVGVGIIWQLNLMVIPICIVIRQYDTLLISIVVLVITSIIMKFTWYDKLGPGDMYVAEDR